MLLLVLLLPGHGRAIDSAEKFPDAQVIAVDINPLLPRFVLGDRFDFFTRVRSFSRTRP